MIDILNSYITKKLDNYQLQVDHIKNSFVLKDPMRLFKVQQEKLVFQEKTLYSSIKNIILKNDHNYKMLVNTLKLVNPLGILEKGYSLVTKNEKVIKSSKDLKINDKIQVRLHVGKVNAVIEEVE